MTYNRMEAKPIKGERCRFCGDAKAPLVKTPCCEQWSCCDTAFLSFQGGGRCQVEHERFSLSSSRNPPQWIRQLRLRVQPGLETQGLPGRPGKPPQKHRERKQPFGDLATPAPSLGVSQKPSHLKP